MNGYYYMSNYYYIILVLPMVILSMIASARVNSAFKKYSQVLSSRRITGAQAAFEILRYYGITNVQIERVSGNLTDHFDPKANVIRLSDKVYNSTSVAAIGVAAHEVGHAIQHATNYAPVKIRTALVPVTNFGSSISMILIMIGIGIAGFSQSGDLGFTVAIIGLLAYCLVAVFQFVTMPVEFNASSRALKTLENMGLLYDEEIPQAKKVLSAAALTYVAALASTLSTILSPRRSAPFLIRPTRFM